MNKILIFLVVGFIALLFGSCDSDIDFAYQGKDRIQFKHYTTNWNGSRIYSDSLTISLGLRPDSIRIDTAKIIVELLGKASDVDRTYRVTTLEVPDSVKATPGVHYQALDEMQVFHAGKFIDTLKLIIFRDNLSTSFRNPQTIRIDLALMPSEDFDLGLEGGVVKKIKLNNYLSEPDWWTENFGDDLGYYHPKKWKILISFHEDFANQHKCPFDYNNDGRAYTAALENYLRHEPTYDDETGERLYMYEMRLPENE